MFISNEVSRQRSLAGHIPQWGSWCFGMVFVLGAVTALASLSGPGCARSDTQDQGGDAAADARDAHEGRDGPSWRDAAGPDSRNRDARASSDTGNPANLDARYADVPTQADTGTGPGSCAELDQPNELIADRRFRRGFVHLDQATGQPDGVMRSGFCAEDPIWHMAQWGSLGNLSQVPRQVLASGSVRWENQYGRVTVGSLNAAEADLAMAVWAYQEYGGEYYVPGSQRTWVHLLAQQRISPPGVNRPGCPPISSLESLHFRLVVRLLQDDPHYQAGYDPNKHAAQFLVYFTVQNLNPNSPGFGDYLWFGITPYDDRYDVPPPSVHSDVGTGRLIYNLGGEPFLAQGLTPGGPEAILEGELLTHVRAALQEAWAQGFLQDSNVLSDYRIGGMNIGWEVPGLNDVEMRVRELSLTYAVKPRTPLVFRFDTDGDPEGWTAYNMQDQGAPGPEGGRWIFTVSGTDPQLLSPELELEAATHPTLRVVVANNGNPASTSVLQVFWDRFGDPGFREARSIRVPISNGGGWQTVDIDVGSHPEWKGEISRVRIDPIDSGDGHAVGIDEVSFLP